MPDERKGEDMLAAAVRDALNTSIPTHRLSPGAQLYRKSFYEHAALLPKDKPVSEECYSGYHYHLRFDSAYCDGAWLSAAGTTEQCGCYCHTKRDSSTAPHAAGER